MKTNTASVALLLVGLTIGIAALAQSGGDSVQLKSTALTSKKGQIAYLGYEAQSNKPPVTPISVFVNSSRPQTVSVKVGVDGVDRSFTIKTEKKENVEGAVAELVLPKPDNATSLPSGRKISVRAAAEKNTADDYIILSVTFK